MPRIDPLNQSSANSNKKEPRLGGSRAGADAMVVEASRHVRLPIGWPLILVGEAVRVRVPPIASCLSKITKQGEKELKPGRLIPPYNI